MNTDKYIRPSLFILLALSFAGCSESGTPNPVISPATREEMWSNDIDVFAIELPRRHVNLFANISREEFNGEVSSLRQSVSQLDDAEIILGLARIVAGVGDAHTTLSVPASAPFHVFPLDLYWFSDGLTVVGAAHGFESVLGKRVLSIGGTPVRTVFDSVKCYFPHENDMWAKSQSPQALIIAELLIRAGLIADPMSASFEFEGAGSMVVSSVPLNAGQAGVSVLSTLSVPLPLYLKNTDANYWCDRIDSAHAVYCQYNRCAIMASRPFSGFVADVLRLLDSTGAEKFVLDLRENAGGNSSIIRPLIDGIKARPSINRPGRLFVLIGRRTFSSALINSYEMKNETHAMFIGEPTGGKPNACGEVQSFVLPYSHVSVQYSTKYFRFGSDDDLSLNPDLTVELSSSDYLQGKDPVLDAALRFE